MTVQSRIPNRLINATSPYLLQHAWNPVQWYEWGMDALQKAKEEDKPILVSIGYSSCHWCHVMEHESFVNTDIAAIMNEHFVCIKVDREERPDIDQVYMAAVQAMQQHGGWPLNVFLTPDQKPFFGGTYFPPKNWSQLLLQINKAFQLRRSEINTSAEEIKNHLQTGDLQRFSKDPESVEFTRESMDNMFRILSSRFDPAWGGIEKAPKFVMPSIWLFLLRYYSETRKEEAKEMVTLTLDKMARGGLYDQVGGGFSRYSVDERWFAPHFEKMLYDNAQLLSLYAEAYAIDQNDFYKQIVFETLTWLEREMKHPEGGFYSALDADSEGTEGKYYTWSWEDLTTALPKDNVTAAYYGATREGNWEHGRNILIRPENDDPYSTRLPAILEGKKKLFEVRERRIHPGLDDKVLCGWNGMMVQGLTDSYKAFGDTRLLDCARQCMGFIEQKLIHDEKLYRAFKVKHSETEGFLEDYAFLVQAYASLYQVTFDEAWLEKAKRWCQYALTNFHDGNDGYFHFSSRSAEKLIVSNKEIFDNVIPSANSVMARNLFRLGTMLDREEWKAMARNMSSRLASLTESEPGYMTNWGILFSEISHGTNEVIIVGHAAEKLRKELHRHYLPFIVTLGAEVKSDLPLLQGREAIEGKTMIYVCSNKTCKLPVESVEEALATLRQAQGDNFG